MSSTYGKLVQSSWRATIDRQSFSMDTIRRIELFHVSIPLPTPFYPSWIPGFPQTENRFTLIRVITESGVEGFSAGPALGKERAGLGELVGPYLVGEDAEDISLIQQRLREISYLGWRNYWIEPAFWDIRGKSLGKPVYELLGGRSCTLKLYASTGEIRTPEEIIEQTENRYAEGFRAIKIRIHSHEEKKDCLQISRVCEAIGKRMKVAVDANQGWRVTIIGDAPLWGLDRAKRFADACHEAGIAWLEEPLPMDSYDELAALTAHSKVPIAGGELHTSGLPELKMMIERRCYDIFQPDAIFTGGIAQTMEVIKLCQRSKVTYSPHTWTNGIGLAVNLQLMAASGYSDQIELEYPICPPGWTVEARDAILEQPFEHKNGQMRTPDQSGLGFTISKSALRKYGKRFFVMDRKRLIWFSLRNRGLRISKEIERAQKRRRSAKPNGDNEPEQSSQKKH